MGQNTSTSSSADGFGGSDYSPSRLLGQLQPGVWLRLEQMPHAFSHFEALLVCQLSEREWVTWIPDYGEYHLQF